MEFSIPGIDLDLEPLEPFYDDVFAGMDEHPAGPWPHHILNPAELHQQQVQSTHFPAIDCNLLDEQAPADAAAANQQAQLASSPVAQLDALPGTAQAQQADSPSQEQPAAVPEALAVRTYEAEVEAAASSSVLPAEHDLHASCHAEAAEAAQAHGAVPGMSDSSSDACADLQRSERTAACEQAQWAGEHGAQEAGSAVLNEGDAGPAVAPMPAWQATANSEHQAAEASGSDNQLPGEGESSAAEAATVLDGNAAGDAAASTGVAVACAEDSSTHAEASAAVDSPPNSSSEERPQLATDGAAANDPAAHAEVPGETLAAAVGAEPSSGSLPDIDDVPEEQEQQQEHEQQQQDKQPQQVGQQQEQQQGSDGGLQQQVVGTGVSQPGPDGRLEAPPSAGVSLAPCAADQQQPAAECHTSGSAATSAAVVGNSSSMEDQETVQLVSAAAVAGDSGPALPEEQEQQSVHEDFGSPCSSWHSCVTAASKASSLNSSRGFFLQPPTASVGSGAAAGIVAALKAASSSMQETAGNVQQDAAQEPQQQQQASRSGVSSPAMVSSLHLALQQQQQQQSSQHSEQLAGSAAFDDPLGAAGTASVSSLAAGIPEVCGKGAAGSCGADDSAEDSSREAEYGSSSPPIAVQCAHEHYQRQQQQERKEDDTWQSVSPPSFSSSPGLLVSAVSARAAAAAATQDVQDAAAQDATAVANDVDPESAGKAQAVGQSEEGHQEGPEAVEAEDDDLGHGCFYADAAGLSMSPEQGGMLYQPGMMQHHPHQHMAASSYMLRQSELVDLSLSTSMHPSQLQHMQQQVHPGWLTAHQQLPPAAAQAVERAVVALNDSYCSPGRASPSELLGTAAAAAAPAGSSGGARAMGVAAMGAVGGAIRRTGAGVHWNRAHTQPQQDQQARHRLPSQAAGSGPAGGFGWPGAAVLGDWFSAVQQPLAAAASRAAVGVGQRLGMAHGQHQHGQQGGAFARQHSSSRPAQQGMASSGVPGQSAGSSSNMSPSTTPSRLASASAAADASADCAEGPACSGGAEDNLDDAVLVEKTSDLPQSLQEQEDEAFRGLLFLGGRDSQGRPVVIVNTDAIPAGHNSAPRDAALAYMLKRLSPLVTRVSQCDHGLHAACVVMTEGHLGYSIS